MRPFLILAALIDVRSAYYSSQLFFQPFLSPAIPITPISHSVYPTPDSSILVDLDAPACKRITSGAISPDEVIPLIEAIFTNQNEVKMIGYLRGDDAQTFIDVIHEVRLRHPSFPRRTLISLVPFGSFTFGFPPSAD